MEIKKFTDNLIKGLGIRDKYYTVNCNSLVLKVYSSGVKTWYFNYRFHGKNDHQKIGRYPYISLADANEAVLAYRSLLEKGINPKIHDKEKKAQAINDLNAESDVQQNVDLFLKEHPLSKLTGNHPLH